MKLTIAIIVLVASITHASEKNMPKKKYKISVCSVFKNEEKFLKEWIEYHRLIGIEHFYLYNTQSTDHSTLRLQKYIREGIVSLTSWPTLSPNVDSGLEPSMWSLSIQIPAYEHAAKYLALPETEWLVFLDINEYLLPGNSFSLIELLDKYDAFPGIDLSTDFFDASEIDQIPQRKLLIQSTELSKPILKHPFKRITKTIFKPDLYIKFSWPPYRLIFKEDQKPIATSKKEIRINQYENRFNGYIIPKRTLGKAYIDNRYMPEQEIAQLLEMGYEIEDQALDIFRFIPELLKNMELTYEFK